MEMTTVEYQSPVVAVDVIFAGLRLEHEAAANVKLKFLFLHLEN